MFNEESVSYSRLITHVRLFAQRLITRTQIADKGQDFLYNQVVESCSKSYECVRRIGIYVESRFGVKLTKQEELYLTIHVHRVLNEHE